MSTEPTLQSRTTVFDKNLADAIRQFLYDQSDSNIRTLDSIFCSLYEEVRAKKNAITTIEFNSEIKNRLVNILDQYKISILPHHLSLIDTRLIQSTITRSPDNIKLLRPSQAIEVSKCFIDATRLKFPLSKDAIDAKNNLLKSCDKSKEPVINQFFDNRKFYSKHNIENFSKDIYPDFLEKNQKEKLFNSLLELRKTLPLSIAVQAEKDKLVNAIEELRDQAKTYDKSDKKSINAANGLATKLENLANDFYDNWRVYDENELQKFKNAIEKAKTPGADYPDYAGVLAEHRGWGLAIEKIVFGGEIFEALGLRTASLKDIGFLENKKNSYEIKTPVMSFFFKTDSMGILDKIGNAAKSTIKHAPVLHRMH